eukprot:6183101-Pyramimonas_sp.AAC.1
MRRTNSRAGTVHEATAAWLPWTTTWPGTSSGDRKFRPGSSSQTMVGCAQDGTIAGSNSM